MKWGVRRSESQLARARGKLSTDSDLLSKAAKRYDKKVEKGSLHSILGMALEDMGFNKAAKKAYSKADYKEAKWAAKAERARKIKNAYNSYMKDLDNYEKSGRGNDIQAILSRSKLYDSQVKDIKKNYKDQIEAVKKFLND